MEALVPEHHPNNVVAHEGDAHEAVERDGDAERTKVGRGLDVYGRREEVALLPEDGALGHAARDAEGRDEREHRKQHRDGEQQHRGGQVQPREREPDVL